jgi:hypothetical protein
LVEATEENYPSVTVERLGRLARNHPGWKGLTGKTARLVREAVANGILLSDTRHRLTRSGAIEPIVIYRLNRRHPVVAHLADENAALGWREAARISARAVGKSDRG